MVKFGHYVLEASEKSGIPFCEYLDYKSVKKQIIKPLMLAKSETGFTLPELTYKFRVLLESEMKKIRNFIANKSENLYTRLQALVKEHAANKRKSKTESDAYFLNGANVIGEEYVCISSFVAINKLAIDKSIKKHDKNASILFRDLFPSFLKQLLPTAYFDNHILALSDFYALLRGEVVDKNVGVGTNFERQSIKYWVHPQDAMTVIMIIIRHLPVYSFKSSEEKEENKRKCISDIKSVYYDNESLYMYHTRLKREEGAAIFRIRWYDDKDDKIFMERKVHHESWVSDSSTKERFILPQCHADSFLAGHFTATEFRDELVQEGKAKTESIDHQVSLFQEVYDRVDKNDLFPSIRTHYLRMAYQIPGDASVRISLDLDVLMSTEWFCPPCHWRTERTDMETVYQFPYVIMEVKLSGAETPGWVQDLTASKFVEAVPKFSKFGHATAVLHPERITASPYWFDQMDKEIESIYKPVKSTLIREFRPAMKPSSTPQHPARSPTTPTPSSGASGELSFDRLVRKLSPTHPGSPQHHDDASDDSDNLAVPGQKTLRRSSLSMSSSSLGVGKPSLSLRVPWWQRELPPLGLKSHNGISNNGHAPSTAPAVTVKARIEPKTYFANERTFLHWLSISSLVAMLALGVLRRNTSQSGVEEVVGGTSFLVSLLFMLYALFMYSSRTRDLVSRRVMEFADIRGPLVLTLLLASTVTVAFLSQSGLLKSLTQ